MTHNELHCEKNKSCLFLCQPVFIMCSFWHCTSMSAPSNVSFFLIVFQLFRLHTRAAIGAVWPHPRHDISILTRGHDHLDYDGAVASGHSWRNDDRNGRCLYSHLDRRLRRERYVWIWYDSVDGIDLLTFGSQAHWRRGQLDLCCWRCCGRSLTSTTKNIIVRIFAQIGHWEGASKGRRPGAGGKTMSTLISIVAIIHSMYRSSSSTTIYK